MICTGKQLKNHFRTIVESSIHEAKTIWCAQNHLSLSKHCLFIHNENIEDAFQYPWFGKQNKKQVQLKDWRIMAINLIWIQFVSHSEIKI